MKYSLELALILCLEWSQVILSFFQSWEEGHMGSYLVNMVVELLAMMYKQVHYHDAFSVNYPSIYQAIFYELASCK